MSAIGTAIGIFAFGIVYLGVCAWILIRSDRN